MVCRDMPPPGGFEAVKYKRNIPISGPSGLVILGCVTAICTYGFYRVGKGNLEKRQVNNIAVPQIRQGQQATERVSAALLDAKRGYLGIRPQ
jgi:hypothetical protein